MADNNGSEAPELDVLRARLEAAGLHAYADELTGFARPSVRLISQPGSTNLAIGSSKLGGSADLPAGTQWPRSRGEPLDFFAQINLADTRRYASDALLPADGVLSFFYDTVTQPWGFDSKDAGCSAVLYTPGGSALERRDAPRRSDGVEVRFREAALSAQPEWTFAPWESYDIEMLGMTQEAADAYADLGLAESGGVTHRLLGHPDAIQGDMQRECQLASSGVHVGGTAADSARAGALPTRAADWRLLLQIDSDDAADMKWGDSGRIYFWMTVQALERREWSRAWLILQCC